MTHSPSSPDSATAFQQQRGRHYDIIQQAIASYDEWMKDDDYDSTRKLREVIETMRERVNMTDAPDDARSSAGSGEAAIQRAKNALDNLARLHGYELTGVELSEAVRAVARALRSPDAAATASEPVALRSGDAAQRMPDRDAIAAIINDRTMINDEGFQNSEAVADAILALSSPEGK